MRRTTSPESLPGCCFRCRSANRDLFVDIDLNVEFEDNYPLHGAVYFCDVCINEMSALLPEQTKHVETISRLEHKLYMAEAALSRYRDATHGLVNTVEFAILTDIHDSISSDEENPGETTGDSSGAGEEEQSGPSEPINDEGVGNLSTNDGFKLSLDA